MKVYIHNNTYDNYYIRTRNGTPIFGKSTKAKFFTSVEDAAAFITTLKERSEVDFTPIILDPAKTEVEA